MNLFSVICMHGHFPTQLCLNSIVKLLYTGHVFSFFIIRVVIFIHVTRHIKTNPILLLNKIEEIRRFKITLRLTLYLTRG